jgi:hypothetical protein
MTKISTTSLFILLYILYLNGLFIYAIDANLLIIYYYFEEMTIFIGLIKTANKDVSR